MHKGKKILNYRNITKKGGAQKDKKERNKRRQTAKNLKAIYRKNRAINAKTTKREQNKNYKMYQNIEQTFPQGVNQPVANSVQVVNGNQPAAVEQVVNGSQVVNEAQVVNGNQLAAVPQAVNRNQPAAVPANKRNRSENATQKAINRRSKTISENDEANRSANLTSLFNKSNQPAPEAVNVPVVNVPVVNVPVVNVYRSTLTTEQQQDYNILSNENKKKYKNLNEEQKLEFNIINSKYKTRYLNANKNGRNKIILEHPGNDANEAHVVNEAQVVNGNRPVVNEEVEQVVNAQVVNEFENDANGANNFEMLTNAEVKEAKIAVSSNKPVNSKSYTFKCNQLNKNATHRKFKCKRVTSKGVMNSFFGKKGSTMFGTKGGKHSTRKRHKPRKSRNTGSKN